MKNLSLCSAFVNLLIWGYFVVCWIVNLVQLFNCDFEPSYKEEIIKLVGVVIAPTAGITVWY